MLADCLVCVVIIQIIVPMPTFETTTKKPSAKTPKEKEKVWNNIWCIIIDDDDDDDDEEEEEEEEEEEDFQNLKMLSTKCRHFAFYFRFNVLIFNSLRPSEAYICVSKPATLGSDNGLSPGQRQAIIWTNAGILLIGP